MSKEMMKAAVLTGPQQITIKEVPVPEVGSGEGWGPDNGEDFFMGHEFCGVVTDPGDSAFSVGDRVVFWANLYCGVCDNSSSGQALARCRSRQLVFTFGH